MCACVRACVCVCVRVCCARMSECNVQHYDINTVDPDFLALLLTHCCVKGLVKKRNERTMVTVFLNVVTTNRIIRRIKQK